jgi:hypothetical protein
MTRTRRGLATVLMALMLALPLPGCAGGPGAGLGAVAQLALSIGASVGSYFLVKELTG